MTFASGEQMVSLCVVTCENDGDCPANQRCLVDMSEMLRVCIPDS